VADEATDTEDALATRASEEPFRPVTFLQYPLRSVLSKTSNGAGLASSHRCLVIVITNIGANGKMDACKQREGNAIAVFA
jgi:hypothetical protein